MINSRFIFVSSLKRMRTLCKEFNLPEGTIREGDYLFLLQEISMNDLNEIEMISQLYQPLLKILFNHNASLLLKIIPEQQLLQSIDDKKFQSPAVGTFFKKMHSFFLDTKKEVWKIGNKRIDFNDAPLVMGIVNVTPDSFSDGGKFLEKEQAIEYALEMESQGADIIDIGGESTRPGAQKVPMGEELQRVIPVIEGIRKESDILISIDTYKSSVADMAIQSGADIINDISGMRFDDKMPAILQKYKCPYVIMHIQGTPENMQKNPGYADVQSEVYHFLQKKCEDISLYNEGRIIIDPGFGFGKSIDHNLLLLRDLLDFSFIGKPVLIGVSRKSFIGKILEREVDKRFTGTIAAQLYAVLRKASILRVHDVTDTIQAKKMLNHILAA